MQHAADSGAPALQGLTPFLQGEQRGAGVAEEALALGGQPQAAGGAGQQACLQLGFEALEGGAGHRRRALQPPRGGGKAAGFGGAHEDLEIVQTQHFQFSVERASLDSGFFFATE